MAAPLFSQEPLAAAGPAPASQPWHKHLPGPRFQGGYPFWFTLNETLEQVREKLGVPRAVSDIGPNFVVWQYQIDVLDTHEFSHVVCIRKSDNKIISVARNYEFQENVDGLFPPKITEVHRTKRDGQILFSARVRKLTNGRLLLAMGSAKPGQSTPQLLLIRRSELPVFLPWLEESLAVTENAGR